jgi:hypothetical protein
MLCQISCLAVFGDVCWFSGKIQMTFSFNWLYLDKGSDVVSSVKIGVLCSQAMLASLGLGEAEAAGGAVAIQWVLKDGIGEVGKLFFIKRFASSFDSHPKTWKFVSIRMFIFLYVGLRVSIKLSNALLGLRRVFFRWISSSALYVYRVSQAVFATGSP